MSANENVYYELTMLKNDSRFHINEPRIKSYINEFSEWTSSDHWIGGTISIQELTSRVFVMISP